MATSAHCAYCFEVLSAKLERRKPLDLKQFEDLWNTYQDLDLTQKEWEEKQAESPAPTGPDEAPMFVTWDTISSEGSKRLRGCIGTFEPYELEEGLKTYALVAALEDHRFQPMKRRELPTLACSVTLLTDFEPAPDPMAWEVGKHGIRISFYHEGRRYGSTYLPDVALEQGWTKEEAMVSLMRKAGWNGKSSEWDEVKDLKVIRYQGNRVSLNYEDWKAFDKQAIRVLQLPG